MTTTLILRRPDDWHVHLREGAMLRAVLPFTARTFGRAIVMPNLRVPVTTTARAKAYRSEIMKALTGNVDFTPLMTIYLTDTTDASDLEEGHKSGIVTAAKLYPAHATTNSEHGVTDVKKVSSTLERMQKIGMPLLVHGEVTDRDIDIFDREAVFIDRVLKNLRKDFPGLKIVFEHITTKDAVEYVRDQESTGLVAATITPHHLFINRNALFSGGIRPHFYCLPIAKREKHRLALIEAATSGAKMFFLGTDTAPHTDVAKENACGCAGIFCAPQALELYAQCFDQVGRLDKLEGFSSLNGPAFYGLPVNKGIITLCKVESVPEIKPILTEEGHTISPFVLPSQLTWTIT